MGVLIKVFDSRTGNFASNKKVSLHSAMGYRTATTDSSGAANFPQANSGNYTVYVDGREVHKGSIVGVITVTIW